MAPAPTALDASAASHQPGALAQTQQHSAHYAGGRSGSAVGSAGPSRRALRVLLRLRPAECALHAALLEEVAAAQPGLGAEVLGGGMAAWSMEPQVCTYCV